MRSQSEDAFLEDDVGTTDARPVYRKLFSRMQSLLTSPKPTPTVIYANEPKQACLSCGCCGMSLLFIGLIAVLVFFITTYSLWTQVIGASTTFTGLMTRTLALQTHYTFTEFMETGGGNVNSLSATSTGEVAILHGWFDLHSQRTDWNVVLFQDTFGNFPNGSFFLWAKRLNETTHTMDHVQGSPWPLNSTRTGSKTGQDLPPFLRQGLDDPNKSPLFYWFVVQSSQTLWSARLHSAFS